MKIQKIAIPFLILALFGVFSTPPVAQAQVAVGVSVSFGPPDLPVYDQPICPGEDYIWTPGYWDWDGDDYFWVPGTWVLAPQSGFFWTPGYWAWGGSGFIFTAGYWGPVVGFYGGINYGYGYFGRGYEGGRWERGHFFYNRAVNNVNVTVVHNTYNTTIVNRTVTRVSYNGGNGGINARATREEEAAARERRIGAVEAQTRHVQEARQERQLRAAENHGRPPVAATEKPGEFRGNRVVAAREAGAVHGGPGRNENRPESRPENRSENNAHRSPPIHARDLPPRERPSPPNTGDPKRDRKYQQEQEKVAQQQAKDRETLQRRQEQEDQRVSKQHADQARQQQMEQRHQQQTQRLEEKHNQQQQKMQQRQQPQSRPAPSKPSKEKPH